MLLRKRKLISEVIPAAAAAVPVLPEASSSQSLVPVQFDLTLARRLGAEFFDRPCMDLCKAMLGKLLVRTLPGPPAVKLVCRIVETEAYLGGEDMASHSYNGRKTERNAAMFMAPGTAYVYLTYGMYECFNISSQGEGSAVLLRAAEPLQGLELMQTLRTARNKSAAGVQTKILKTKELCNGPAKLCLAMNVTRQQFNKVDLITSEELYLADDGYVVPESDIQAAPRIGIGPAAKEWAVKPLRVYVKNNAFVSVLWRPSKSASEPALPVLDQSLSD